MSALVYRCWVGVVSQEHVSIGVRGKFCQVCHGKKSSLSRMKKGDWLVYYSPKISMSGTQKCQKFTAIGKIADENIFQYTADKNFTPFRRNVDYLKDAKEVSIYPLLNRLTFTQGKTNWGILFRFGLFEIPQQDFTIIHKEMCSKQI